MRLRQLLNELKTINPIDSNMVDINIKGIADNSQDVREGYLFVAISGYRIDGHDFIEDAVERGASVIIGEKDLPGLPVPYIQVDNSRKALGAVASSFYHKPARTKTIVGITGTNGKTTTSFLMKHILENSGVTCSVIGTVQNIINGKVMNTPNTTPSSLVLQELLAESEDQVVILEVSSHALTQYRVEGVEFDYALFTNLHHEHLDYHQSMEEYFGAKCILFQKLKPNGKAVVNADDEWGEKLIARLISEKKDCLSVGQSVQTDIQLTEMNSKNSTLTLTDNKGTTQIYIPMAGLHNMYNTAMAYSAASSMGGNKEKIVSAICDFPGVNGRFEMYKQSNRAQVVIDYAHTADAIYHCLNTARESGAERVIHVFGFRGNRDKSKRQDMLSISADISDKYILTMDDLNSVPRGEMISEMEILQKKYGNNKGSIVPDRTRAIKTALEESRPGDWIIITGKGHEQYQQSYELPTSTDKETIECVRKEFTRETVLDQ
ncbi:UDP-N-acetylmuramoyl-L-alanyl-D-glutamate--2,6-diaminopimelate ligase [Sediminibacillus massiliensis]|uniref:UDP-N-acetylmuramoyl-L-alanyl-D-glutamate--2, 6-diaminopimelate ligase n=1 Tax=Sediminibacillus massiliensis TaxID=1926277 RepID=UPI00098873FF|nr:UDP-N-acetylmuramoyl-L-alanyl-D-glutamate--2,6-diaminopimelate ligase [Sediminibacillus massiliensis]